MPKSRTYFEQIPLVVVKKIAEEAVSSDEKAETVDVMVEPSARKSRPRGVSAPSPRRKGR